MLRAYLPRYWRFGLSGRTGIARTYREGEPREGGCGTVIPMGPGKSFWGPRFQERRPTRPRLGLGEQPTHARHTPSPVWASPMGPEVRSRVVAGTAGHCKHPSHPFRPWARCSSCHWTGRSGQPFYGAARLKPYVTGAGPGGQARLCHERVPGGCDQATPAQDGTWLRAATEASSPTRVGNKSD